MSTSPGQLLPECWADTQASELPRRILSPANELVNVTRGGRDRCPPWIDVLCNEGHWPTEKCWWSSRLETRTSHTVWEESVNTTTRTGSYQCRFIKDLKAACSDGSEDYFVSCKKARVHTVWYQCSYLAGASKNVFVFFIKCSEWHKLYCMCIQLESSCEKVKLRFSHVNIHISRVTWVCVVLSLPFKCIAKLEIVYLLLYFYVYAVDMFKPYFVLRWDLDVFKFALTYVHHRSETYSKPLK